MLNNQTLHLMKIAINNSIHTSVQFGFAFYNWISLTNRNAF